MRMSAKQPGRIAAPAKERPGIQLNLEPNLTYASIPIVVQKAESFDMERVLQRYMKECRLSRTVAESHERELKRYLVLSAVFVEPMGMRGDVDALWHTFILFTRRYFEFCHLVAGDGVFIHHEPDRLDDSPPPASVAAIRVPTDYARFWVAYERVFGTVPPAHAWPQLAAMPSVR
jgi:hypothetical protein